MNDSAGKNEGGRRTAAVLTKEEIDEFLKKGFWGVLSTSINDEPYGVPIIYAYDDDGCFYVANGPGRKIQTIEKNPNVTLTVVEVEDYGKKWKSVIVFGKVEVLHELGDKLHAFNALRKQVPRPTERLKDAAKLAMAKVIRITPTSITGKAVGY